MATASSTWFRRHLPFAGMEADPPADGREGVALLDDRDGLFEPAFADEGDIAPGILVGGAGILAGCVKERAADALPGSTCP